MYTKKDFKVDWFSGKGAGGQHRNKHQNCCRITHSSGLRAHGTRHRERRKNQRDAFHELARKLLALEEVEKSRRSTNEVVRTYHFERGIATDGHLEKPIRDVMNGDILEFIERASVREPVYSGRV